MTADDPGLARFHGLSADHAEAALRACCGSARWSAAVAGGRPYADREALLSTTDEALAELDWADVREALDAHPRIGARVSGGGREAAWSRGEQSAMVTATDDVRTALAQANRAYERRFGHVLLIFATGRTDIEMLTAARDRLLHDERTEHEVVRGELASIVALRVTKLLDSAAELDS